MMAKSLTISDILDRYNVKNSDVNKLYINGPDTLFLPDGHQSLYACGYIDYRYRVIDSDDLLRVRVYYGEQPGLDELIVEEDYFKKRREYNRKVGILAEEFRIPFLVSVTLGTDRKVYEELVKKLSRLDELSVGQLSYLKATSVFKNKEGLREFLGENLFKKLEINKWGAIYAHRLAEYVYERAINRTYKRTVR